MNGAARTAARETVETINALCSGLARIPGPKTVVMLSEGFSFDGVEPLMAQAIAQAARAGARFYTVDARGAQSRPWRWTTRIAQRLTTRQRV